MSSTIYTVCIKQFWTTLKIKIVNDDGLQALIDGRKVVFTKASIRHDLQLNGAEGTSCLPNIVIFEELARIGYEKPSEKLTFYKDFFSSQWKFFIHTILQWFSGAVTPLFVTIMVQVVEEVGDLPTIVQDIPIHDAPSSSQHQRKHKPRRKERKETEIPPIELHIVDHVPTTSNNPLPSGEDRMQLKELMVLCTNLSNKVLDLENEVIEMKSSHKAKIAELESRVEKLEKETKSLTNELISFNTRFESPTIKEIVLDKEESSKQGRKIIDIDTDAEVNLENVYNLNMAYKETVLSMQDVTDADVKEVAKEIVKVITTAKIIVDKVSTAGGELNAANEEPVSAAPTNITTTQPSEATKTIVNITTALKAKGIEGLEIDAERIIAPRKRTRKKKVEKDQTVKKQKGDELEQDNTKKQKLEEQQEAKELKRNLEIVPDDEDDVFVNVTPLSSKPPTIMDYKIYMEGKKEHFQIIRANGNHQMYLAFSIILKNFDREDLEVLWKIVKDRFKESQPKKVLDVFLWHILKVMFEHTVEDSVWKLQKGHKGLARMYPLTNYTLQQMFNEVRLQVDYKVEIAYDLSRLIFMENIKFRGGLLGYKVFIKLLLLVIIMKKTLSGAQLELYRSILHDHMQRLDVLPPTLFEGYDRDLRELYTRTGRLGMRFSLSVTGQVDAQRAALWHAIYDIQKKNHDLRMQIAEEKRERLKLTDRVARMERRQESRGE
nr:hypothetical protein [Tanacetum cinerariifolium]